MSETGIPAVSMRYRLSSIQLLEPGLQKIVIGVADPHHRGNDRDFQMAILLGKAGTYDREWADMFADLWKKLSPRFEEPPSTRRIWLRLDRFEVAAIMLAARVARRVVAAGQRQELTDLLGRLENHRRRAVRYYVSVNGRANYRFSSTQWRKFLRWTRYNVLWDPSRRVDPVTNKSQPTGVRSRQTRWYRLVIREAMEVARRELTARGQPLPPEGELRRLVRLAVRYVRQGRAGFSTRTLITTREGATYLGDFILARTRTNNLPEKSKEKTHEQEEAPEASGIAPGEGSGEDKTAPVVSGTEETVLNIY